MRALRVIAATAGPQAVLDALRDALAGGPALFVDAGSAGGPPPARVAQSVGVVVETSGTTGRPKRVALPADAVLASAAASESALGGPAQWVLALPVHYIAGLNVLARSISAGIDPVPVGGSRFTAEAFTAAADRLTVPARCTALVPAQLTTLLDDPAAAAALRGFAAVLIGGQATPAPLLARARAAGIRVVRSYGSSETSGGCVYDGVPLGSARVRIEDGEVWLGGATLADGYLDDPALTEERFVVADGARWFRTADAGLWDGERLRVTGRRDDVIVSGGVKVALSAIEEVLREQPGFAESAVVGVVDDRWGERAVAVAAGDPIDDAAALAAVTAQLGPAGRPVRVVRVSELPRLPSGKTDRAAITALAGSGGSAQ